MSSRNRRWNSVGCQTRLTHSMRSRGEAAQQRAVCTDLPEMMDALTCQGGRIRTSEPRMCGDFGIVCGDSSCAIHLSIPKL